MLCSYHHDTYKGYNYHYHLLWNRPERVVRDVLTRSAQTLNFTITEKGRKKNADTVVVRYISVFFGSALTLQIDNKNI